MLTTMRAIEIFVRAVESGSFVGAARGLLIDPASVSRAIKALEEDLGVSLFARSTRTLKLMTEGARFYRDGAQMLNKFQDTITKFKVDTGLQGQLKVGMGPALSRPIMLRAVASFHASHPEKPHGIAETLSMRREQPPQYARESEDEGSVHSPRLQVVPRILAARGAYAPTPNDA